MECVGQDRRRLEDWMEARKKKNTKEKYKFVACVLSKIKLSIQHRKSKSKDKKKKIKDNTPGDLGPEHTIVRIRSEGPPCTDSKMAGSMANFPEEGKLDWFQRRDTHGGKRRSPSQSRTLTASNMVTENTTRKQITGLTFARKDGEK